MMNSDVLQTAGLFCSNFNYWSCWTCSRVYSPGGDCLEVLHSLEVRESDCSLGRAGRVKGGVFFLFCAHALETLETYGELYSEL